MANLVNSATVTVLGTTFELKILSSKVVESFSIKGAKQRRYKILVSSDSESLISEFSTSVNDYENERRIGWMYGIEKMQFIKSIRTYQTETKIDKTLFPYILYLFATDATYGNMDIQGFQDVLGYEKVSECIRVHKACVKMYNDLTHIYNGDIYDLVNELQEKCNL